MVQLQSTQINDLKHIDEIQSISPDDHACLEEIREVLAKYGLLSKFGVTLLHKHFDLEDNEILLETCDNLNRTLTARPVKIIGNTSPNLVETVWRFDGITGKSCSRYCPTTPTGKHYGYSEHD